MSDKLYQLHCQYCNYKRITDGTDEQNLVEVKRSPLMRGVPKWDKTLKRTINPSYLQRGKLFKCPSCGKASLKPKKIKRTEHVVKEREVYSLDCTFCNFHKEVSDLDVTDDIRSLIPLNCPKCNRTSLISRKKGKPNENDFDSGHQASDEGPTLP